MKERSISKAPVMIGKTRIGGEKLVQCVPVVAKTQETLISDLEKICALSPDLIEWRIDYFSPLDNQDYLVQTLKKMTGVTKDIPILLTFRAFSEGGYKEYPDSLRLQVVRTLCSTGMIQAVDIELENSGDFITAIRDHAKSLGVKLILSWHNIHETPPCAFMVDCLLREEALGADIAKLSVQPGSFHDVVTLLEASMQARERLSIPQITVSKDDLGILTRIIGSYLGSDLTFFSVSGSSTIGQVSLEDYRALDAMLAL